MQIVVATGATDGLCSSEEILQDCATIAPRARDPTFTYTGKAIDVKRMGRDLSALRA
jgi:hypothetical protein